MDFSSLSFLTPGDTVDIISPSSFRNEESLEAGISFLKSWGLSPRVDPDLFGDHFLYAHSIERRFEMLKEALFSDSKAIWCLGGGFGSSRLIPLLHKLTPPPQKKLFIGYSDITALHMFLSNVWGWTTFHAAVLRRLAEGLVDQESIEQTKDILFGKQRSPCYSPLVLMNPQVHLSHQIDGILSGGNLSIIENGFSTLWELDTAHKILFFEEVNERAYRTAERLEHYRQAGHLDHVKAIIFCDFLWNIDNLKEANLTERVFLEFASSVSFPVFRYAGIGHGKRNLAIPVHTPSTLYLERKASETRATLKAYL